MTSDDFRRLALSLRGASEQEHHGHPDFRAAGKIFATLGYPDCESGMVKLNPEQQRGFILKEGFVPVKGSWGEKGATNVRLTAVNEEDLQLALEAAWKNVTTAKRRR